MKKIIIQKEITITQKEVDETIQHYKEMPDTFGMGLLGVILNRQGIISEIKKLSKIGKMILLMRYEFKKHSAKLSKA